MDGRLEKRKAGRLFAVPTDSAFCSSFHGTSLMMSHSGVMAFGAGRRFHAVKASGWLLWSSLLAITAARSLCGILDQRTAIVGDRLFWSRGNDTFDDGVSWANTSPPYWLRLNDTIDVHGPLDTAVEGSQFAAGWTWDQRSLGDIHVYDICSNTWCRQKATGDIPAMRSEFCAGVSAAPDDSSFQVTITGGWDQLRERAFNDAYVLSLPAFRWIRIAASNNPDAALQPSPGRTRHKCAVWRDAQLIATGGLATLGEGTAQHLNDVGNTTYPPVRVLDTSTYTWRAQFQPGLEYSVPDAVAAVTGGNSTGGAVLSSPAAGWDSDELSTIFSIKAPKDTYDDTTSTDSAHTSATAVTTSTDDRASRLSGGAIAGIVIGCLAVFVATVVAVLWWKRRRRTAAEREMASGGWEKPELEAREQRRQEPDAAAQVHETHGDVAVARPAELPVYARPLEMPG